LRPKLDVSEASMTEFDIDDNARSAAKTTTGGLLDGHTLKRIAGTISAQ
jgi:hypothetical protein